MYRFMPSIDRVVAEPDPAWTMTSSWSPTRASCRESVGSPGTTPSCSVGCPILVVDHHASNVGFGAVDYVDPRAAAAGQQVALLVARLGVPLDALGGALAGDLMAGIIGDTASFQHSNVTPRTLRVSAELLAAGAPMSEVTRRLYRSKPNEQLRLFGVVLSRLELPRRAASSGGDAPAVRPRARRGGAGAVRGIIDLLAQSATAEVAVLFRDQGDTTRISTRTRRAGVPSRRPAPSAGRAPACGRRDGPPVHRPREGGRARARGGLVDAVGR